MKIVRDGIVFISVYSLPNSFDELASSGLDLESYSRLKYGCAKAIDMFSAILLNQLQTKFDFHPNCTYFTSTLLTSTPSASHWLAKGVVEKINRSNYYQNKPSVKYIDIVQKITKPEFQDYGKLSSKQRQQKQRRKISLLTLPIMKRNDLIIIVNDINVTGQQLKNQSRVFEDAHLVNQKIWLYLCKINEKGSAINPKMEDYLNNYAFPTDESFLDFLIINRERGNLYPTKRLLLKILTMSNVLRLKSIALLNLDLRRQLFNYAISENMHLLPDLVDGVKSLEI